MRKSVAGDSEQCNKKATRAKARTLQIPRAAEIGPRDDNLMQRRAAECLCRDAALKGGATKGKSLRSPAVLRFNPACMLSFGGTT